MAKEAVFNLKLEPELRADFMAAAEAVHRPASQVMRDFIRQQQQVRDYDDFLHRKVEAGRAAVEAARGRSNEEVEATFAARRDQVLGLK
ncbi:antitoxin of toxin-antitoxin stability system [Pseudomonas lopnurensis]|uniref:antitoxin of toxin-antitoxin stability system n=1 Tax=Pseudomonas lopnurensis TaxID=1477517 RepID=UPI0018798440|nr:antitoxin of toxin-antitoxin stability system [Pseudomonas lopnurensis]MBE7375276.1 antitoxin of toxin-antitoxin stability system [Pseudomonas lopnurensis]